MIRLIPTILLLLSMTPVPAHAAGMDAADLAVTKALSEALQRDGVARIEVTLDLTAELAANLGQTAAGKGVHPVVFDIVMMAAQGPMQLEQAGKFHLLRIAATEIVVGKILEMKEVLAVYLDTEPLDAGSPPAMGGGSCPPS